MTSLFPEMTNLGAKRSDRLYLLDALRGLAALSVVFWHWQHFFLSGPVPETVDRMKLPLYDWFFLFYEHGWLAIDLFFCLSGFVFYWQYSRSVAEGSITPGTFAILRLSRLYPLHVATLVLVAIGQYVVMQAQGTFFVYEYNDLTHFLLNLLFASSWGLEQGYSFNGPVWSISIEVLLYALFFACCRILPVRLILLAAISLLGFLIQAMYHVPIGRGVGFFFLGGCVYLLYQQIMASSPQQIRMTTVWAVGLLAGAWLAVFVAAMRGFDISGFLVPFPQSLVWAIKMLLSNLPTVVLFPLTILALVLLEYHVGPIGQSLSFLGDISYSSYLLHFPLQLFVVILATRFNVDHALYYSGWAMAGFFVVLLTLSLASHRYVEIPMQRFLRKRLIHCS
ncbi:MAG: acyltransferase [Nitrospirota bacterium]|nr:acyltransferase [Nitrospirota bacterium]